MVGWHHQLNGHEFEQTPGDSEGKPGMLQVRHLQRVRHNLVTEQQLLKSSIVRVCDRSQSCAGVSTRMHIGPCRAGSTEGGPALLCATLFWPGILRF